MWKIFDYTEASNFYSQAKYTLVCKWCLICIVWLFKNIILEYRFWQVPYGYCSILCYQFYLQDTKSSNGTFVNNQRLSKGAEESPPREVCSGDIVQFGVDVMENSRKGEFVPTKCVIMFTVKLYLFM